jgi:membrane associated rhomboid family serine protease
MSHGGVGSPDGRSAEDAGGAGVLTPRSRNGVPVCYRHPQRETYITCSRCERSICPDCMISAAVGYQCPECVRAGHKDIRPVRDTIGARVPTSGITGLVTKVLIGVNIVVYGLQQIGGSQFDERFELIGKAYESNLSSSPTIGVAHGEWYRLVTMMFLHESFWHIALNMLSLWVIGTALETMIGRVRLVATYFVAGFAASATSYLFMSDRTVSLGASGAIFGLAGALLVIGFQQRYDMRMLFGLIVLNLVVDTQLSGIDWHAHVGGLVAGVALGAAFAYGPRAWRSAKRYLDATVVVPVCCAVLVVGVGIAMVAAHTAALNH